MDFRLKRKPMQFINRMRNNKITNGENRTVKIFTVKINLGKLLTPRNLNKIIKRYLFWVWVLGSRKFHSTKL